MRRQRRKISRREGGRGRNKKILINQSVTPKGSKCKPERKKLQRYWKKKNVRNNVDLRKPFSLRHKSQSHKEKSDLYDLLKIKYCHGHHKAGQNTMGEQQTLFALFPVHKGEHPQHTA